MDSLLHLLPARGNLVSLTLLHFHTVCIQLPQQTAGKFPMGREEGLCSQGGSDIQGCIHHLGIRSLVEDNNSQGCMVYNQAWIVLLHETDKFLEDTPQGVGCQGDSNNLGDMPVMCLLKNRKENRLLQPRLSNLSHLTKVFFDCS